LYSSEHYAFDFRAGKGDARLVFFLDVILEKSVTIVDNVFFGGGHKLLFWQSIFR
jgi:hypothetical protein